MALFNYTTKEITIKVVYYGPGLSGKTTNLQYLHYILNSDKKSKLVSLPTETDRTLFFDLLPIDLGKIRDFSIRFQLYTVPGQVRYNATRKLVLKGADAIVFVADSQQEMKEHNIESFKNMRENLLTHNIDPDKIPILLQYNKRDLTNILSVDELNKDLNQSGKYQFIEAIAIEGIGVKESFQNITTQVIDEIEKKQNIKSSFAKESITVKEEDSMIIEPTIMHTGAELTPTLLVEKDISKKDEKVDEEKIETLKTGLDSIVQKSSVLDKGKYTIPFIEEETYAKTTGIEIKKILTTLKEMENLIKEVISEQKKITIQVKDIIQNLQNIKIKRKWFWFK
ncbi:MAG: GTP-binding protein [Thermodesulfovibrionales bacterium]